MGEAASEGRQVQQASAQSSPVRALPIHTHTQKGGGLTGGTSTRTPPATRASGAASCSRVHVYLLGGVDGPTGAQQVRGGRLRLAAAAAGPRVPSLPNTSALQPPPGPKEELGALQAAAASGGAVEALVRQQARARRGVDAICTQQECEGVRSGLVREPAAAATLPDSPAAT